MGVVNGEAANGVANKTGSGRWVMGEADRTTGGGRRAMDKVWWTVRQTMGEAERTTDEARRAADKTMGGGRWTRRGRQWVRRGG